MLPEHSSTDFSEGALKPCVVLELLAEIRRSQEAGQQVALATLVDVRRSAPRDPGAVMAIASDGTLFGSISGGCVEAALAQEAQLVLRGGRPRIAEYGLSDADAQAVGLSCGGTLAVLIQPLDSAETQALHRKLANETLIGESIRLDEDHLGDRLFIFVDSALGSLGNNRLDDVVATELRASVSGEATEIRSYGSEGEPHGDVRVFIQRVLPKPRMYVFGAIDFAHAMVRVAKLMGYEVTLCDARPAFATTDRFPEADRIVVLWPDEFLRNAPVDERTAIVALTHDEKFDIPLIQAALETNAGYIGVMGSRRTNERRLTQLRELGATEEHIARLNAPIGLDLGARTPEETAIAIMAEIIALRHGREGGRLVGGAGSIRGHEKVKST